MKAIRTYISNLTQSIGSLYLHPNLFYLGSIVIFLFALSFVWEPAFQIALIFGGLLLLYAILQIIILFSSSVAFEAQRELPEVLSLGEFHKVSVSLYNLSSLSLSLTLTESLPYQLGVRNATRTLKIENEGVHQFTYEIRPTVRGIHKFGDYYLFLNIWLPVVERKLVVPCNEEIDVYPSIIQMKKFELYASKRLSNEVGVKKTRRLGHGSEFEQIKQYIPGDDPRTINWKASARAGNIMTNHYQEERSQPVYQILDSSRAMKMPFNGLSLLDHSINSALALSNIILKKGDKTGLLSFDKKVHTVIEANNSSYQLKKMLKALYSQEESQFEANYELLYFSARRHITKRSFIILYTNFESIYALERVLAQLTAISKRHLLLVVSFENTELTDFSKKHARSVTDIYDQTMAKKLIREKSLIHTELDRHGIMNISVTTETLTADVINKYLEVKSRGAI